MFLITVSRLILLSASGTAFAQEQQNQTSAATSGHDNNTNNTTAIEAASTIMNC
jgi:hypothetical protein